MDNITKDAYVYYEEIKKLKGFEFFPHIPMNIEAPASISERLQFMWRLPFVEAMKTNDYIFDINVVEDDPDEKNAKIATWSVQNSEDFQKYFEKKGFPIDLRVSVKYEYHMRY